MHWAQNPYNLNLYTHVGTWSTLRYSVNKQLWLLRTRQGKIIGGLEGYTGWGMFGDYPAPPLAEASRLLARRAVEKL